MKLNTTAYTIFRYSVLAIAFFLPFFPGILSLLIVLSAISLILTKPAISFNSYLEKVTLGIFLIFFILHLVGLIYSSDVSRGFFIVVRKLSFLIFPLIFISIKFDSKYLMKVLLVFIAGCFIASVLDLFISLNNYFFKERWIEHFYGTRLSHFIHMGYFAMYLNFAIASIFYLSFAYKQEFLRWRPHLIFLLIFLSTIVLLTTSRNQILVLILIVIISSVFIFKYNRTILIPVISLVVISILFFIVYKSTYVFNRFSETIHVVQNDTIHPDSRESTELRLMAWDVSIDIIRDYVIFGTGTGDLKKEMDTRYKDKGYSGALDFGLNPHSQYLHTFAMLGITGIVLLLLVFLVPLFISIKHRDYLLFLLVLIVGLAALTESIFESQAGIIFYTFFSSILLFSREMNPNSNAKRSIATKGNIKNKGVLSEEG